MNRRHPGRETRLCEAENVDMQEEIFLPVEQSGRERSIIEVLDEMMASLELPFAQKRAAQLKIKKESTVDLWCHPKQKGKCAAFRMLISRRRSGHVWNVEATWRKTDFRDRSCQKICV